MEQDCSARCGADLLHSFEAHGVVFLTAQLKNTKGRERKLLSVKLCTRRGYLLLLLLKLCFSLPTSSYLRKLLKLLLKQLPTHPPMLMQLSYRSASPTMSSAELQNTTLQRLSFLTFKNNSTMFKPTFCCIFFTK